MREFLVFTLVVLGLAAPVTAQSQAFVSVDRTNRKIAGMVVDRTHNHGKDRRIDSRVLGMPRDLYVYLPPGYCPQNAYPLILYFHGGFGDEHAFIEGDRIEFLDWAIVHGLIPPVIVACPDGIINGRNLLLAPHSFYINGEGGRFEDHVIQEIIPHLAGTYSIRPERQAHAILGLSAGGLGAINLAVRHRDYFGSVAVLAAPANLRYDNVNGDYMEDFHAETYRWRSTYDPDAEIAAFASGLLRFKAGRFLGPVFGTGSGAIQRIARENPVEVVLAAGMAPGELPIFMHYAGKDNLNFDAQAQSFDWLTGGMGLDLTVGSDPSADHSIDYFRETQKKAYLWLGRQLTTPAQSR